MVLQTIEQRIYQRLVVEQRIPRGVVKLRGDDRADASVALIHQAEEGVDLFALQVEVAELVDAQRLRAAACGCVRLRAAACGCVRLSAVRIWPGIGSRLGGAGRDAMQGAPSAVWRATQVRSNAAARPPSTPKTVSCFGPCS